MAIPDVNAQIMFNPHLWPDTQARWGQWSDGTQQWSSGSAGYDTQMARLAGGGLYFSPRIFVPQNVIVGGSAALGDNGVGEIQLTNATTVPTTNPTGGLSLFAQNGLLNYINPQGLVSVIVGSQGGITAPVTVANSAAETQLQAFTLPAADAVAAAVYRLRGWGTFSWTGTPTIQFTVRLGGVAGTILAQMPAFTLGTAQTGAPFEYEILVNFLSSTSAQALMDLSLVSATASDAASPPFVVTPTAPVAVSVTTTKALVMDVTWGTAAAGNTISLLGGYTERVS